MIIKNQYTVETEGHFLNMWRLGQGVKVLWGPYWHCLECKAQTYLHSSSSRWSSAVGFLLMRLMQPVLSM